MKRKKFFSSLGIVLVLVLALMPGKSVLADAPVRFVELVDATYPVEDSFISCGFEITEHYFGTITYIVRLDKDGNIVAVHATYGQMNGTWTANGKTTSLQVMGPLQYHVEPDGEVIGISLGAAHILTLPGYGFVWGSAGRSVFNAATGVTYSSTGRPFDPNWPAICEYFAN